MRSRGRCDRTRHGSIAKLYVGEIGIPAVIIFSLADDESISFAKLKRLLPYMLVFVVRTWYPWMLHPS